MWIITHIWTKYLSMRTEHNIELTCSECGKAKSMSNAIGKTIKPCGCEING